MTNLKRSFFWAAFYLAVMFVLGEADYAKRPIIDFAAYFYLAVIVAVPVTLFFPSISRVSAYVPMLAWMGAYLVLLQIKDRLYRADPSDLPIIVLEFVLLEAGVWLAHQLALQISHAESIMDALALSAFPNRAQDIESEHQRIKIELTRSRRYHRPLSLVVVQADTQLPMRAVTEEETATKEMLKSIQHDLLSRFTSARVGQIIDDCIRQTDIVMRDRRGRFIILCPETDFANAALLARRISQAVKGKANLRALWGVAAFPEEALTFDDLLQKARERLADSVPMVSEPLAVAEPHG